MAELVESSRGHPNQRGHTFALPCGSFERQPRVESAIWLMADLNGISSPRGLFQTELASSLLGTLSSRR